MYGIKYLRHTISTLLSGNDVQLTPLSSLGVMNAAAMTTFSHSNDHDDVIKWKYFPRYWPFVRGTPVNSPYKAQWRGALMFSLICVWINGWVNSREAGDLIRYRAHYDVIVMMIVQFQLSHTLKIRCGGPPGGDQDVHRRRGFQPFPWHHREQRSGGHKQCVYWRASGGASGKYINENKLFIRYLG